MLIENIEKMVIEKNKKVKYHTRIKSVSFHHLDVSADQSREPSRLHPEQVCSNRPANKSHIIRVRSEVLG